MADSEKPEPRRVYRVLVEHVVYVVADSAAEAERWAEGSVTDWGSDPPELVEARTLPGGEPISEDVLDSLPWVAGGISDEETDKPIRWWRDRKE